MAYLDLEKVCIPESPFPIWLPIYCPPSVNRSEIYIILHPLNFLVTLVDCFISYCVRGIVLTVQYFLLLGTQVLPFLEVPLTLEKGGTEYNYASGFFLPSVSLWFLVTFVMTSHRSLHTTLTTNVTWKLLLTLFFFSNKCILMKLVPQSWFVAAVKGMMALDVCPITSWPQKPR
jgi:hypothetical protein